MGSHGGFGAIATVSSELIDDVLWTYTQLGPMYFPPPDSVSIGPIVVRFAGIFEMLRPTIELQDFPANLVTLHFAFHSILRAQIVIPGTTTIFRGYDVELRGSVTLQPFISVQAQQIFVGIDTATVVFGPLAVVTVSGPPPPPEVTEALQSPILAQTASAFVQNRPNIMLTPPTLSTLIEKTFPGDFKDIGVSEFEWFTIRLEVGAIVLKLIADTITVGVDFIGYTSGDIDQLDTAFFLDSVWIESRTPEELEQLDEGIPPYLWKGKLLAGGNFGALFNMDVISKVTESVSRQTTGTDVSRNLELSSVSLSYGQFTKPLYPGQRDGLWLRVQGTVHPTDVDVSLDVYIQAVVTIFESGPTSFLRPNSWSLRAVYSELHIPWWADLVVFVITVLASLVLPVLFPIFVTLAIAVTDGVLPALLDTARDLASKGIERTLSGLLSPEHHSLPGLPSGFWDGEIRAIAILPEGLHTTMEIGVTNPIGFPAIYQENGIIAPENWRAEIRRPMPFHVKLSTPMEQLANLSVLWEVFRTDNNSLLRARTRRYLGDDVLFAIDPTATVRGVQIDPDTNGILIGLRDPDYYFLDAVRVRCSVTASFGTQSGVIWSSEVVVPIPDDLDRTRDFVEWGPNVVYFANFGTNGETWSHNRTSKIHRTATGARCEMLRQRAEEIGKRRPKFRYSDTLPAEWFPLEEHRHFLCDFCFFGGPDKSTPFPLDKWF